MKKSNSKIKYGLVFSVMLWIIAAILSLCIGSINFTPLQLFRVLQGETGTAAAGILRYARIPRTAACLFAGAALSCAGAVLQNVLANQLASPSIIGVNAGAGLGVTLCCAAGAISGWAVSGAAFVGSLAAVAVIALFSCRTGASRTTVILTGVALNSLLNAAAEAVTVLTPDVASFSTEFRVGGFSAVTYTRLITACILIVLALCLLLTLCSELDVIALGDETARGLGLPVTRYRITFLILSALLAGAAVSFSGLLGFVGLIVPHFVRMLFGNESRRLMLHCIFLGGAFVTLCDLASRCVFQPFELPVGILMSVLGGPAFVFLLVRCKGGHHRCD